MCSGACEPEQGNGPWVIKPTFISAVPPVARSPPPAVVLMMHIRPRWLPAPFDSCFYDFAAEGTTT